MGWWSWEYLPSRWDSGDEATGPQIVETITLGRSPGARTARGRRQSVRLRPITRRHLLVRHTADSSAGGCRLVGLAEGTKSSVMRCPSAPQSVDGDRSGTCRPCLDKGRACFRRRPLGRSPGDDPTSRILVVASSATTRGDDQDQRDLRRHRKVEGARSHRRTDEGMRPRVQPNLAWLSDRRRPGQPCQLLNVMGGRRYWHSSRIAPRSSRAKCSRSSPRSTPVEPDRGD